MQTDSRAYLNELQHAAMLAGIDHEIWWVLTGSETRGKYLRAMNKFSHFFYACEQAHLTGLVIALYRLYETRTDTYNVPQFLNQMEKGQSFSVEAITRFKATCDEMKPLLKKIYILRNKNFGHRSNESTAQEVFKEAQITPNELKDLVEKTKELINSMSVELDDSSHGFLNAHWDTISLLENLNKQMQKS